MGFCVLNDCLIKLSHAFLLVKDCIWAMDYNKCKGTDLKESIHSLRLSKWPQIYCRIFSSVDLQNITTYIYAWDYPSVQ